MKHQTILILLTVALLALTGCGTARSVWKTVSDAGNSLIDVAEGAQTNIVSTVKSATK